MSGGVSHAPSPRRDFARPSFFLRSQIALRASTRLPLPPSPFSGQPKSRRRPPSHSFLPTLPYLNSVDVGREGFKPRYHSLMSTLILLQVCWRM